MKPGIEVSGVKEIQGALSRAPAEIRRQMQLALDLGADMVLDDARRLVPRGPSGAARASLGVDSGSGTAEVFGGGRRAPYYLWLEFGGSVGRRHATQRRRESGGRYIPPSFGRNKRRIVELMEEALADAARASGLEVT